MRPGCPRYVNPLKRFDHVLFWRMYPAERESQGELDQDIKKDGIQLVCRRLRCMHEGKVSPKMACKAGAENARGEEPVFLRV